MVKNESHRSRSLIQYNPPHFIFSRQMRFVPHQHPTVLEPSHVQDDKIKTKKIRTREQWFLILETISL